MIVLMYHGIVSESFSALQSREAGAELYDVNINDFRAQMSYLKEKGMDVVITFDDGEENNYQVAFPVLKELKLKAIFFVIVKRIGKPGYLNWEQLKEMANAGMSIGSHGLTHEILTNLLDSQMEEELRASKVILERNLDLAVTDLSIPRGFCNDLVLNKAYGLGYKNIYISDKAYHIKQPCITRTAVKKDWSMKRFTYALAGKRPFLEKINYFCIKAAKTILRESGYNWLRKGLIYLSK